MTDNDNQEAVDAAASDEQVLFPEYVITIGGEDVTVREFTFMEGIRFGRRVEPLIVGMEYAALDNQTGLEMLGGMLVDHEELMLELMATACDRDVDYVAGLSDSDGHELMMTFWAVNRRFFLRRLAMRQMGQRKTEDPAPDGAKSSPSSSPTDMPGANSSDATPSGK